MNARKFQLSSSKALLVSFFLAGAAAWGTDVSDDFNRSDGNVIGVTELTPAGRWVEYPGNATNGIVKIANGELQIWYAADPVSVACNVGGFTGSNIDLSVKFKPLSASYGKYYGVGYRMPSQTAKYRSDGGYYIRLNNKDTPNMVYLYYGSTLVTNAEVSFAASDYHTLRVVAIGASHWIYIDDGLAIETTHSGNTDPGYVGCFCYYSIAKFDDFELMCDHCAEVLSDDFNRGDAGTNIVGQMASSGWLWNEDSDNANGDLIGICSQVAYLNPFVSQPYAESLALNLNDYEEADVEVRASLMPYTNEFGACYGVGYRLASPSSRFRDADGYYVQLDKASETNSVSLWYGDELLTNESICIPEGYVELQVVAAGDSHTVYLCEGEDEPVPVIAGTHSGKTSAGYAGIFASNSIVCCDKFEAGVIPAIRPETGKFLLGLIAITLTNDMEQERRFGWNMSEINTIHDITSHLEKCHHGGLRAYGGLPCGPRDENGNRTPLTEAEISGRILSLNHEKYVYGWTLPDELRYWKAPEWAIITNYTAWTRTYDGYQRPNYMYIPGHYKASSVSNYVPYLDIVPASLYTYYYGQPNAWVRWRMEETLQGIAIAGATIGYDYLNGERIPAGVLQLFLGEDKPCTTFESAYHDFWSAVCCGSRGFMVYAYAYIKYNRDMELLPAWDAYCKAASEITGPENVGPAVLEGTVDPSIGFIVTSGPTNTEAFYPSGFEDPIQYPSLNLRAMMYESNTYIIAVNSATSSVTANITNLPAGATTAKVLFEGRSEAVAGRTLTDSWSDLGVRIYKVDGVND